MTPIFLISLLILELVANYLSWVAILGIPFVADWILHARSILGEEVQRGSHSLQVIGMMLTIVSPAMSAIRGLVWEGWNLSKFCPLRAER